jgi:hypothetical protein
MSDLQIPRRRREHAPSRRPKQLPDERWTGCRHYVLGSGRSVGPVSHRHLGDPLYESNPYVPIPSQGPPPKEKTA